MGYFVTGATGFIGRHVTASLAKRGEHVYVLVRAGSRARLERLLGDCGDSARWIVPIEGDLDQPLLGVAEAEALRGKIQHFLHLGALYDLDADASDLERVNVGGTQHALDLAHRLGAGCFHLVSSIAVAGEYPGRFTESMFAEACALRHPYFTTKHQSEALVRGSCRLPWRIYRPGMVVGHSVTGEMDKIDGPYYFFKAIQKVRDLVPHWMPLIRFDGGYINLVPVDFVASALTHLLHLPGQDGKCFHLTDAVDRHIGAVLNIFAHAAHAPAMTLQVDAKTLNVVKPLLPGVRDGLKPMQYLADQLLRELGIPPSVGRLLDYPTTFDSSQAQQLLTPAGIRPAPIEDYAWRLWDYWERQLDPELFRGHGLRQAVAGKTVLITGGSSGIGRATALELAKAHAKLLLVARDQRKLNEVVAEVEAVGATVAAYSCDITDADACSRLINDVQHDHGTVDVLVNNAGHSIRRAIEHSYERLHDYERLIRINYLAAVRLTLGLLPAMVRKGSGHVIGISSIGVLGNAPRFAAYNASKAALEAFIRSAAAEYSESGVHFTVINLPLVRTPMVEPTKVFQRLPLITADAAAATVCRAIVDRPQRLATPLGVLARLIEILVPQVNTAIMSETFRMLPESEAAGGPPDSSAALSPDMLSMAALLQGIQS
jgi:NAD(P)-dependent dehydrogenase (short-subunit alcohol dehydrogenase family)